MNQSYFLAVSCLSIALHGILIACFVWFREDSPPIRSEHRIVQIRVLKSDKPQPKQTLQKELVASAKPSQPPVQEENNAPAFVSQPKTVKKTKSSDSKQVKGASKNQQKPSKEKTASKKDVEASSIGNRLDQLASQWETEIASDAEGAVAEQLQNDLEIDYEQQVQQLIKSKYELPSILSMKERRELQLILRIYIDGEGQIVESVLEQSSQKPMYDQAILAAARRIRFVGRPPLNLKGKYMKEGLLLKFCPIACR